MFSNKAQMMPIHDSAAAAVDLKPFSVLGFHAPGGSPVQSDISSTSSVGETDNDNYLDYNWVYLFDCVLNASALHIFDPIRAFWSMFGDKIVILALPVLEPYKDVCTCGLEQLAAIIDPRLVVHSMSKVSDVAVELLVDISQYTAICGILHSAGWVVIPAETPYSLCGVDVSSKAQMIVEVKRRYLEILMTSNNNEVVGYYQHAYNFLTDMQQSQFTFL